MSSDQLKTKEVPEVTVIATAFGFILHFASAASMRNLGEQLIGQAEASEQGLLGDPPYLHATFEDQPGVKESMEVYLSELKHGRIPEED